MLRFMISIFLNILSWAFFSNANTPITFEDVQPIFEARCISCHSCFNAPCQLNLQSYEGFERGATLKNIYDGARLKSVSPSRMFIDAHTTSDWRLQGFFPVSSSEDKSKNLFLELLRLRRSNPTAVSQKVVDAVTCPKDISQTQSWFSSNSHLGMPFGFPPLTDQEYQKVESWIVSGAKNNPVRSSEKKSVQQQIKSWETFFNQSSLKQKLVSRYLYEHLFLAHIYFPESPDAFYRIVRSKTNCSSEITEIATRRPNDPPNASVFYYCLKKDTTPVVYKTHMPFEFSNKRLREWNHLFFKSVPWSTKMSPNYSPAVAKNPFVAFKDIPTPIKYNFLLSEAQYHVMTFIKGPVCNGTSAVNSIQEQFYVFFMDPQADPMKDPQHVQAAQEALTLPGEYGSDIDVQQIPVLAKELIELREIYRKLRVEWYKQNKPKGLGLNDIWNGDTTNNNALLTVFRHNDNAVVLKGAVGDLPKTVFILDYSLFERLVYNLVVNFDVFGNVGHQYLTRVYMDFIRMEAEENFLLLLPPQKRQSYREDWYRGALTQAKMKHIYPDITSGEPTAMVFKQPYSEKREALEQLISRFSDKVRGQGDSLNWRNIRPLGIKMSVLSPEEQELQRIASVKSEKSFGFAKHFPETAYLVVRDNTKVKEVYSVIHNREFTNISWIMAEDLRRDEDSDTLTLRKGYWIPYPEKIFNVESKNIKNFVDDVLAIKTEKEAQQVFKKFEAAASDKNFWATWDDLHNAMKNRKTHEGDAGLLDLTRYLR